MKNFSILFFQKLCLIFFAVFFLATCFSHGVADQSKGAFSGLFSYPGDFYEVIYLQEESDGNLILEPHESIGLIETNPGDDTNWNEIGTKQAERKDWRAAKESLSRAIKQNPQDFKSWSLYLQVLSHLGDDNLVLTKSEEAIKLFPKNSSGYRWKGWALYQLDRHDDAIDSLQLGLHVDPNNIELLQELAHNLIANNEYEEAIETSKKIQSINNENFFGYYIEAYSLLNLGKPEEAINAFNQALALDDDVGFLWTFKGLALGSLGKFEEAMFAFDNAINLDSEDSLAISYKSECLRNLNRNNEALELIEQALKILPSNEIAWNTKGLIFINLEKNDQALESFNKALEYDPNFTPAADNIALGYIRSNQYNAAIDTCYELLQKNPNDVFALFNLATSFEVLNKNEDALRYLDKAIINGLKNDQTTQLKIALLEKTGRYDEALSLLNDALLKNPNHIGYLYSKGNLESSLGNYQNAIDLYDKAITINQAFTWGLNRTIMITSP